VTGEGEGEAGVKSIAGAFVVDDQVPVSRATRTSVLDLPAVTAQAFAGFDPWPCNPQDGRPRSRNQARCPSE
jgi:hypothetical protein